MAFPDAWTEFALISIQQLDGTEFEFMAITESIDIAEGDHPGESIPDLAGDRVWRQAPQEDGQITLEMYPIEMDLSDNSSLIQQWSGGTAQSAEPRLTDTTWEATEDRVRDRFRIAILWTNDISGNPPTPPLAASEATAAATDSIRFAAIECRMISHRTEFTEGILKVTVTFKYPAITGTQRNWRWESGNQTALASLGTYTVGYTWS